MWIDNRAPWFFGNPPEHWNPWTQLIRAGLASDVPKEFRAVSFKSSSVAVGGGHVMAFSHFDQNLGLVSVAA